MQILFTIGVLVLAIVLTRVWTGILNSAKVEGDSLQSVEKQHPYLPHRGLAWLVIGVTVFIAALIFVKSSPEGGASILTSKSAMIRTGIVILAAIIFSSFDTSSWSSGGTDRKRYLFAFIIGTVVTWILIKFKTALFTAGAEQDPFVLALGIVCVITGWRFLFSSWQASIKVTVLGTFLFWVAYAILRKETSGELFATSIACAVALVPVFVWCKLFLAQHRERFDLVLLAFFAGMVSTVPILFYSALTTSTSELNFFLFKVVPVGFTSESHTFAAGEMFMGLSPVQSSILATLTTYFIVGIIEEWSKYWMLRRSSDKFFRSIDDVLQMSIIVALGFAFAENLINPSYFVGFVQHYLLEPPAPMWGPFIGNVLGRSVLTTMVHIVSTGVLGYFLGLALYATPVLTDRAMEGKLNPFVRWLQKLLDLPLTTVYGGLMLTCGFAASITLHGMFDFIVTIPDILPGRPTTVGQLVGSSDGSFLNNLSITLIPAIFYVVGGMWLLLTLFARKEDMKERGNSIQTQTFVQ